MHSQIYSGLSLIFAILRNFRVAGENESIRARLVRPAGVNGFIIARRASFFRSKNDENRPCVTKNIFSH